jgi:hypothetical protein
MALLLADKVTNLSSARYFAARGFDWLCFDLAAGAGMNIVKLAAIREWVEGPAISIYLPWGFRPEEDRALADLLPQGWMAGHFASASVLPPPGDIFKEWVLESPGDAVSLSAAMAAWPAATHHLIRAAQLPPNQQLQALRVIRHEKPDASLLLQIGASTEIVPEALALCQGFCVIAPDEMQTGLLSFEELDEVLDQLEDLRA